MGGCHDRRNPTGGSQGKYTWTSINAAVVVGHGGVRARSLPPAFPVRPALSSRTIRGLDG